MIGTLYAECNDQIPTRARLENFDLARGEACIDKMKIRSVFEQAQITLIPALYADGGSTGVIERPAYDYIESQMLQTLKTHLHELDGMENRKAQFRTAISLILDGKEYLFEGVIKGEIIKEKRGDSGFGYDPVFMPEGYDRTFAELGNDIKNQISHRALAVQKLCEFLQS